MMAEAGPQHISGVQNGGRDIQTSTADHVHLRQRPERPLAFTAPLSLSLLFFPIRVLTNTLSIFLLLSFSQPFFLSPLQLGSCLSPFPILHSSKKDTQREMAFNMLYFFLFITHSNPYQSCLPRRFLEHFLTYKSPLALTL